MKRGSGAGERSSIAIIGLAGIFPGAATVAEYFRNVLRQRCFVRELPVSAWETEVFLAMERTVPLTTTTRLGAIVTDDVSDPDLAEFKIPPAVLRQMSRNQKLALVCARRALADAGYLARPFNRERAGVVMAAAAGELVETSMEAVLARRLRARMESLASDCAERAAVASLWDRLDAAHPPATINEDTLPGQIGSLVAGRIASVFDLHGFNETIDSACASSLAALARGMASLRLGDCDLVIAGGVDTDMTAHAYVQFSKVGALSTNGSFPFDARADGFVMGEGCGIVVLKRFADAVRDGDQIHAVIHGWGASSDGAGKGITAPSSAGQIRALRRAYEDAGISPADLHYLECHGTGTVVGDAAELASVGLLLSGSTGGRSGRARALPIGSAKSMVGHLKLAAGMAGLFRAILAVSCRVVPPQVNFEEPNRSLDWVTSGLTVPRRTEALPAEGALYAGVSSFGFGGTNHHIVISSPPQHAAAPIVDANAFVDPSLPGLACDTCLLFPGQGSQYPGMLAGLSKDPLIRDLVTRAEPVCRAADCASVIEMILASEPHVPAVDARLRDTRFAQPALFIASAILVEKLRHCGVNYGMAIGHSLGELSAVHAAGLLSFEEGLRVVIERGRLMAEHTGDDPGRMAVLSCGRECAEEIVAATTTTSNVVVCANFNSYSQTVVSGTTTAVSAVVEFASERGVLAVGLPVSRAFHSPLLRSCVGPLAAAVATTHPCWPRVPAIANRGREVHPFTADGNAVGRPLSESQRDRFIDLISGQAVRPVDFVAQIELAYAAGIRRFVEVGPRGILVGLVDDMLQGKPFRAVTLDPNGDRASSLTARLAQLPEILEAPLAIPRRAPAADRRVRPRESGRPRPQQTSGNSGGLRDVVRQIVAAVSGYAMDDIADDAEFERDLGIDTLKIFEIITRLSGTVLPERFARLREASSVRRILEIAAADAFRNDAVETRRSVDRALACYRFEPVVRPPRSGLSPARRYQFIAGSRLTTRGIDVSGIGQLVDPNATDAIIALPLPASAEALCRHTIPELVHRVAALAERASHADAIPEVVVLTFAAVDDFHAAGHRAITAAVKSLQKDARRIALSHAHIDTPQREGTALKSLLGDPGFGRRLRHDGMIEDGCILRHELHGTGSATLATVLGPDDVVLVTGGARGIASLVVRHLVALVPARFLLVGRRPGRERWIDAEGVGRVEYLAADVRDPAAVARLGLAGRGITLVIHGAGIVRSRPLASLESSDIEEVMGTKVLGLHHVLTGLDLERLAGIVCFSSAAGYAGGDGHPDYAAANAYLDGFSCASTPVLSIGWSAWDGAGMATDERTRRFLSMSGIELIPAARGVRVFAGLLGDFLQDRTPRTDNYIVHAGMAATCFLPRDTTSQALATTSEEDAENGPFRVVPLPARLLTPLDDLAAVNALLLAVVEPPAALAIGDVGLLALGTTSADSFASSRVEWLYTPAERGEIDIAGSRKRQCEKRVGKFAVKMLTTEWLRRRHGVNVEPRAIEVLAGGPPRITVPGDPHADMLVQGLSCSLSHTENLVCAALATRPVGVDVERARHLDAAVVSRLGGASDADAIGTFTRKEAVLKAAGVGIGSGLDDVVLAPDDDGDALYLGARYRVTACADAGYAWALAIQTVSACSQDGPRRQEVPVAPGQEALWFLEQLGANGGALAFGWTQRVQGPFDSAALELALQNVVERHDALRTVFTSAGGRCRAEVINDVPLPFVKVDLGSLAIPAAKDEADRRCRDECMRPFDIAVGPLFRFLLLRLASDDHMLCCVFHHLVMDVSSALVFRVELAAAYRVLATGGVPRPPALALQYSDHAARHLARLTPARIDELVAGWRAVLADRPPQLGLTGDAPTSLSKRGTVGSIAVDLPPHVFRGLAKAAADAGVTLFSAFFAVFAMVYARLSGSDDVVVGTPFAGRTDPDTLPLIGYFISMLPLRLDLAVVGDGDPSFREILPVARDTVLDAVSRHDLPFHLLVERLDPPRAGGTRNGGSSLFRSVLRFFHESSADAALMPGERTFEELPAVGTLYDLSLIVVAGTDAARCRVEYDAGIFTSASAARIGRQFASAFAAVAMDPDCRLSSVPLGDDHARIISAACDSVDPARRPDDRCIEDLFAVQAARTPSAVAITGPSATLTYKQLDEAANRLAHVLVRVGVKPGAVVGLLLDRSVAMVVGMLATLRAGAAYMPLDPAYPPDRLAFMVADSTAAAIVTLGRHTDRLPAPGREGVPRVCLDRDAATLRAAPAGLSRPHPTEPRADRRLACVLYTSGSSGTPKGVAVTHGGIVRLFPDAGGESRTPQGGDTHYVRLKDDDVLLHLSPPSFDASTFEIWGALLNGGRCVVMEEKLPDLQGLGELVVRHRISVLWLTTPLFNAVVDHAPELLRGVRHVLTGGEAASVRHVRRARALFPHLRLTNCYGPTECTTFACTYDVPRHLDDELYSIPIGRPIAHTTVRLVDRRGRAVAPGAVGELVLGGAGVALGYVNRPEQTADRFSVEPPAVLKDVDRRAAVGRGGNDESPSPVGRLYRTGDLARLLPDGTLDFVGRLDDQVKVRGHRVEPGEVEAALRRHAGVRDAAVVMAADAAGQGRLIAFLVPVGGQLDDGASHRLCLDLEAALRRELPPYLVPDAMVVRAELPCTPHGKVDRRRLASEAPRSGSPRPAVRPTNPTEAHIAQIWAELLGLPAVGMADDFFALGGTSLSAVVMVSRVEHILGRRVPLAVLFADPTVAGVARALVEPVVTADDGPLIQLGVRRDVSTVFFLHGDLLGGGLYCRALARELDEVISLVAIHPHGLAGQPEHSSIEAMASAHAEVIRRMQPVGPYRLGGYCNGALEAFEIAKQLVANGEEVSFVALVAPPAIEQATTASAADVPNGGERSTLLRRCAAACAAYRPTFIPVPIVLVQATDDCPTGGDPAGGWRSLSPSVTVDVVQGTHATAVAIHAAAIGARIRERLAAFDGGDSDQARDPTES